MIDEAHSNFEARRVVIDARKCRFGSECLLCGNHNAIKRSIKFGRAFNPLILGGRQTLTLKIPLCSHHALNYGSRLRKRALLIIGAVIVPFFVFFAIDAILKSYGHRYEMARLILRSCQMAIFDCSLLIPFLFLIIPPSFPVKVTFDGRMTNRVMQLKFQFPNDETMQRFLRANEGTPASYRIEYKLESESDS